MVGTPTPTASAKHRRVAAVLSRATTAVRFAAVVTALCLAAGGVLAVAPSTAVADSFVTGIPGTPFPLQPLDPPLTVAYESADPVVLFDVPAPPVSGVTAFAYTLPIDCGQPTVDKEFLTLRYRQSNQMEVLFVWFRFADSDGWGIVESTAHAIASDGGTTTWERQFPDFQHGTTVSLKIQFRSFTPLSTPGRLEDLTLTHQTWVEPPPGDDDDTTDDDGPDTSDKDSGGDTGPGVFVYPSGTGTGSGGSGSGSGNGSGTGDGLGNGSGSGNGSASTADSVPAPAQETAENGATGFVPIDPPLVTGPVSGFVSGIAVTMHATHLDGGSPGGGGGGASGGPGDGPRTRAGRGTLAVAATAVAALAALLIAPGIVSSRRHRKMHDYDHARAEDRLPPYLEEPSPPVTVS